MNKISSLYELVKQKSKEKGRPLKVVSDWDEVIQPVNPQVWYTLAKEKGWTIIGYEDSFPSSFEEFFENFWKNARMEHFGKEGIRTKYTTIKEVEECRGDKEKFEELVRKPFFEILMNSRYYEKTPFLTCAKDLLKVLNEDLISELVFVSTTAGADGRKRKQTKKYFPGAQISLRLSGNHSSTGEYRWQWAKENHPDFDIFIDDNPNIIKEFKENFGPEKILAITDYPIVETIEGVYRIPSKVVERKEIEQSAENYKKKQKDIKNREREREHLKATSILLRSSRRRDGNFFVNNRDLLIAVKEKN